MRVNLILMLVLAGWISVDNVSGAMRSETFAGTDAAVTELARVSGIEVLGDERDATLSLDWRILQDCFILQGISHSVMAGRIDVFARAVPFGEEMECGEVNEGLRTFVALGPIPHGSYHVQVNTSDGLRLGGKVVVIPKDPSAHADI